MSSKNCEQAETTFKPNIDTDISCEVDKANVLVNSCQFTHPADTEHYHSFKVEFLATYCRLSPISLVLTLFWSPPTPEEDIWLFSC